MFGPDWSAHRVLGEHKRGVLPGRKVGRRGLLRFTEADLDAYDERTKADAAGGQTPGSRAASKRRTA